MIMLIDDYYDIPNDDNVAIMITSNYQTMHKHMNIYKHIMLLTYTDMLLVTHTKNHKCIIMYVAVPVC